MRIAIDCRKLADFGIGTYLKGLLRGLARTRADHEFILLGSRADIEALSLDSRFLPVQLEVGHYSLRELTAVPRVAAKHRAELLHNPHYVTPFDSIPMVTTVHDLIHLHQRMANPLAPLYAKWMIGRALTKSHWIATVSETVRNEIVAWHPEVAQRISVTPNGVDQSFFLRRSADEIAEMKSSLGVTSYFLFVGNDKPHKNLHGLIRAFNLVSDLDGIDLVVAGPGPESAGPARIKRPGFVSDEELIRLYQGAVAVVVPSLEEGFGLTALEAMASGVPVITSNAAALVELTGDAAIHVDAENATALAESLKAIASDGELRHMLSNRGTARARAFSWDRCAALTLDIYDRAAS